MDHDHDVRPAFESVTIASLLIAAVAFVARMLDDSQAHIPGDWNCPVFAAIVHQDDFIDRSDGHIGQGGSQSALGVVSRHDGHDLVPALLGSIGLGTENLLDSKYLMAMLQRRLSQERHR